MLNQDDGSRTSSSGGEDRRLERVFAGKCSRHESLAICGKLLQELS